MKNKRLIFIIISLLSLGLTGCSSAPFIPTTNSGISQSQLIAAPFYPQQQYQCGPAALASILNFQQVPVTVDDLIKQIYIPDKKGSLQLEIKAAIRRANLLPYQLENNLPALLTLVSDGQPVLVLQNLGLNFWPQWHYAVVVGFDLDQQTIILHSGTDKNYSMSLATFMNTWQRSKYWALASLQADMPVQHLDEAAYISAATSLESIGKQSLANQAYQSALAQWPNNPIALLGVGNIAYQQGDFMTAITRYLQSIQNKPEDAASWNNLAFALKQQQCPALAKQAIDNAVSLSQNAKDYVESAAELGAMPDSDARGIHCTDIKLPQ